MHCLCGQRQTKDEELKEGLIHEVISLTLLAVIIKWIYLIIKQPMLERQNYKQFIQQQGLLQTTIADGWGYKVNPQEFLYKPTKIAQQPKVAPIQPLKRIIVVPISKKLQKIEDELLMLENQRKLNRLTQQAKKILQNGVQASSNECTALKMMHQRVQEYNFIIDHRHIIQKNSERARKILGIKKSKIEVLNQEVKALKDRLPQSSFSQMIDINKKIAQLYRNYEKSMFQSKQATEYNRSLTFASPKRSQTKRSTTTFNSLFNSSNLQPRVKAQKDSKLGSKQHSQSQNRKQKSKSISIRDLVIMQELKQSSDGQSSIFAENLGIDDQILAHPQSLLLDYGRVKLKKRTSENPSRKRLYTVVQKKSDTEVRKEKLNTVITESFIDKQMLQKGKALDKRLRQNEDVIEVWRQRIDQNKQKNNSMQLRLKPKAKKFGKSLKNTTKNFVSLESNQDEQKMKKARDILAFRKQEVKEEMSKKEKMFAVILRKKLSKFKRVTGTHLMQETDPNETARKILGMTKTNAEKFYKMEHKQGENRKITNQTDEPEWLFIQNDDEKLYWSMCKNEKLNIFLKKNKK